MTTVDLRTECRRLVDEWPEDDLSTLLRKLEFLSLNHESKSFEVPLEGFPGIKFKFRELKAVPSLEEFREDDLLNNLLDGLPHIQIQKTVVCHPKSQAAFDFLSGYLDTLSTPRYPFRDGGHGFYIQLEWLAENFNLDYLDNHHAGEPLWDYWQRILQELKLAGADALLVSLNSEDFTE